MAPHALVQSPAHECGDADVGLDDNWQKCGALVTWASREARKKHRGVASVQLPTSIDDLFDGWPELQHYSSAKEIDLQQFLEQRGNSFRPAMRVPRRCHWRRWARHAISRTLCKR